MARVLVVDDDRLGREVAGRLVRHWGHEVDTAGDGEEALAALRDRGADLVLLDLVMPRLDGLGVLEELAQHAVPGRPGVILVTGDTDAQARRQGSDLGALDFVSKPLRIEELELRVRRALTVLERERQLDAAATGPEAAGEGARVPGDDLARLRHALEAELGPALSGTRPVSCVLVADDGREGVASTSGLAAVEARWRVVTRAVVDALRPSDALFAIGATELAVVAPATGAAEALELAEGVRRSIVASGVAGDDELAIAAGSAPRPAVKTAGGLYRAASVALARTRLERPGTTRR